MWIKVSPHFCFPLTFYSPTKANCVYFYKLASQRVYLHAFAPDVFPFWRPFCLRRDLFLPRLPELRSPLCPPSGPLRASHMLQGPPREDGARSQMTHAGPWLPVYPHWFLSLFLASSSTPQGSVLDLFLLYLNVCPPLDVLFHSLESKSLNWPFLNLFPEHSLVCLLHITSFQSLYSHVPKAPKTQWITTALSISLLYQLLPVKMSLTLVFLWRAPCLRLPLVSLVFSLSSKL